MWTSALTAIFVPTTYITIYFTFSGYGKFGEQKAFTDDKTQISISYGSSGGSNNGNSIYIPQNAEIIDADMGVRGRFQSPSSVGINNYKIEEDPATISLKGYAMEEGR